VFTLSLVVLLAMALLSGSCSSRRHSVSCIGINFPFSLPTSSRFRVTRKRATRAFPYYSHMLEDLAISADLTICRAVCGVHVGPAHIGERHTNWDVGPTDSGDGRRHCSKVAKAQSISKPSWAHSLGCWIVQHTKCCLRCKQFSSAYLPATPNT
jgi:hypothetical protein